VRNCLFLFLPLSLYGQLTVKLGPETVREFDKYVLGSETAMQRRWKGEQPFLMMDDSASDRAEVRKGDIFIRQITPKSGLKIPSGIVHDWAAGTFIKGATLEQARNLVVDFDRHKKIYPEVVDSRLLLNAGSMRRGYHRLMKKKVLTVVLNSEYEVQMHHAGPNRAYTVSHSKKITEIDDPGKKSERELPEGEDHGFLWRLNAYWRFESTPEGVYAECQAISLTRDVPAGLSWIVNPFVQDMPRESLRSTMEATREALTFPSKAPTLARKTHRLVLPRKTQAAF
jgi:hypothetical protein